MNIQIFGRRKSFDSDKAKRFFKERKIPFQYIDLDEKGFSKGELTKVVAAVGGLDQLLDPKTKAVDTFHLVQHMRGENRFNKVLEYPALIKAPVVRDGARATVGFKPDVWLTWIKES